jgi:hypothetical protein
VRGFFIYITQPLIYFSRASNVIIPILAQRLLNDMRKIDYMDSEPFASKLLFSPDALGLEDDPESELQSFEINDQSPNVRQHRWPIETQRLTSQ